MGWGRIKDIAIASTQLVIKPHFYARLLPRFYGPDLFFASGVLVKLGFALCLRFEFGLWLFEDAMEIDD